MTGSLIPLPTARTPVALTRPQSGDDAPTASLSDSKRGAAPSPLARPLTAASIAPATPSPLRWVQGAQSAPVARLAPPAPIKTAALTPHETKVAKAVEKTEANKSEATKTEPASSRPAAAKSGWMIQIGATDNAGQASDLLTRAKARSHSNLASAMPFTEKVQKGEATLYRARFAGLDTASAEAACRDLKRSGFACFATKN